VDRYRIRRIVMTCADKAKVNHPHMGPHILRHSMAVLFLKAGGDVFSLQKMLGHQTLVMTRRYSELADSDVADKHRLCSPADRLRSSCQNGSRKRLT
jgi:integrase/recombinase XerD